MRTTGELQPRDLLAGQMTRPVIALPTGDVDLIGVRFKTGRAGAALRMPMCGAAGSADRRIGRGQRSRSHRRRSARAWRKHDRLNHLARVARRAARADRRGLSAAPSITRSRSSAPSRGNVAIERVARRVGITRRHLERHFREHVGLGAKHLARIARVHSALELLQQQPSMSGAEIAAACGYSDQAHLIRECQELTGQTPQRLKTTERSLAGLMRDPGGTRSARSGLSERGQDGAGG